MKNLKAYKQLLNEADYQTPNDKLNGEKLLALLNHYEEKENSKALRTLYFTIDCCKKHSKDGKLSLNFPEQIQRQLQSLYEKKILTYRFGSINIQDMLEELINEQDF